MRRIATALRLALGFLTVIPVPGGPGKPSDADLAESRFAYPAIGLAIGLALAALSAGLNRLAAPPLLAAFLLVAVGVGITGGLHLDGLADTADGLFLHGDPERRLAAMRDPHLGSFGASALALVLMGKFAALASLSGQARALALVAAATLSRTLILVAAGTAHYARPSGTGRVVVQATTSADAIGSAILACTLGLALFGPAGLAAALVALTITLGFTRFASRRLHGITGDILGALVELGELAILVILGLFQSIRAV
jgi:adenosylcobinamide-GDP ribazoletransferase